MVCLGRPWLRSFFLFHVLVRGFFTWRFEDAKMTCRAYVSTCNVD